VVLQDFSVNLSWRTDFTDSENRHDRRIEGKAIWLLTRQCLRRWSRWKRLWTWW